MNILMKCGHTAQARDQHGRWACIICWPDKDSVTPEETVDLSGRTAVCPSCNDNPEPSDVNLPFFEYRGPGSHRANCMCKNCGFYDVAHVEPRKPNSMCQCRNFEPHGPYDTDLYYCGCWGWN